MVSTRIRVAYFTVLTVLVVSFLVSLTYRPILPDSSGSQGRIGGLRVYVATTTSLYQVGLINDILNDFKRGFELDVEFVVLVRGSGEVLRLLTDGSVCIGFTHVPTLEAKYVARGAVFRLAVFAYNEFVIAGPANDPVGVGQVTTVFEAFRRIYEAGEVGIVRFVSRGDLSGTNVRELQVWRAVGLDPEGRVWYLRSGQGMAETLVMASHLNAYTLTDLGTFLSLRTSGRLRNMEVLLRDPDNLLNPYSAYVSTASQCDNQGTYYVALKLAIYLMNGGQDLVERYRPLFNPVRQSELLVLSAWESLKELG